MNDLQVFNYSGNAVRTVQQDGEPWFVLKDVCDVLELTTPARVSERLDEDEVSQTHITDSLGRQQDTTIVNESGLYHVILRSDKPQAGPFRKWVTSEVLPSIRKTGSYSIKPMTDYQTRVTDARDRALRLQSARLLNQIAANYHGTSYEQVLQARATKELTGEYLLPLPKQERKTYTAAEIGQKIGVSANTVGRIANANGLKVPEYGAMFVDKSPFSCKEVSTFRYYDSVIPIMDAIAKGARA